MITINDILRTYNGKSGCMCGCNGEYRDSDRAKKSALKRVLAGDFKVDLWNGPVEMGAIYIDDGRRNSVIYLKTGTVLPPEALAKI
jgi:hypothetical protein